MRTYGSTLAALTVFILPIAIWLGVTGAMVWVGGSAVTSAVKAVSQDCGETYGAEVVFSGDWFCPEKKE